MDDGRGLEAEMETLMIERADGSTLVAVEDPEVAADIHDTGAHVDIHFRLHGGLVASRLRSELVDAVFDLPQVRRRRRVRVTLPAGDAVLLRRLHERCPTLTTRAAGATCLGDAEQAAADQDA